MTRLNVEDSLAVVWGMSRGWPRGDLGQEPEGERMRPHGGKGQGRSASEFQYGVWDLEGDRFGGETLQAR
jgi:hypothetical protein